EMFVSLLTLEQRRVADSVIIQICRGDYAQALRTLRTSNKKGTSLPPLEESILRRIVLRLMYPKRNTQQRRMQPIMNKALIKQLSLRGIDASLISTMDTHIPAGILGKIYEQAVTLSFDQFFRHLEYLQWVEHTIIQHTLMLYEHCIKLQLAQQAINSLALSEGVSFELAFLYGIVFVAGFFLVGLLL
ncbi:hypothetical protein KR009_010596, partial [Drosophila setifemur]